MITIPLQLPDELAQQVIPLQERLPEIIELGLRHWRKHATSDRRVKRAQRLNGLIAPGWQVIQPITLTCERDADGYHVLSDELFGVYGDGSTADQALHDYVVSLIDYYQLLAARAADDASARALFGRLRQYLFDHSALDCYTHPQGVTLYA
ncbi:MAG: hypothetical protein FJ011_27330 [Chloroflexi bacterium]|nr:hypothetical protein [Chloroflexota bacterium]